MTPQASTPARSDRADTMVAAQKALALCARADLLAREAGTASATDAARVLAILEQRDEMLQDLAEHLVTLRHARPTADSPLLAHSAQMLDEADAVIAEVCSALDRSQRATVELLAKLARRSDELRQELDTVQRAGSAGMTYTREMTRGVALDFRR